MLEEPAPRASPRRRTWAEGSESERGRGTVIWEARGGQWSDSENAADPGEGDPDAAKRRQPKKKCGNIFKSFSDSYNDLAYLGRVEVENGRVKHFVQARRFWQCESDLARWQQSLKDASRHCRSLDSIGARYNPNWHEERVELLMNHNESSRKRPDRVQPLKPKVSATKQLRELQQKILPGKAAAAYRRQRAQADKFSPPKGSKDEARPRGFKEDRLTDHDDEVVTKLVVRLQEKYSSTKMVFKAIDFNCNGILSLNEFSHMIYSQFPDLKGSDFPLSGFWATMDLDEDGCVDSKEFEAKMQPIWKKAAREKRRSQREQKAWENAVAADLAGPTPIFEDAHTSTAACHQMSDKSVPEWAPPVAPEPQPKPKPTPKAKAVAHAQPPLGTPAQFHRLDSPLEHDELLMEHSPTHLRRLAAAEEATSSQRMLGQVRKTIRETSLENVAYSLFLVEVGHAQTHAKAQAEAEAQAQAQAQAQAKSEDRRRVSGAVGQSDFAADEALPAAPPPPDAPPAAAQGAAAAEQAAGARHSVAPAGERAASVAWQDEEEDQEERRRRGTRWEMRSASKTALEEIERGHTPTTSLSKVSTTSSKRRSMQVQVATSSRKGGALKELPSVKLPQTMTLLVFRNADPTHCGEPVFVKRWPLASLKELLTVCSAECRPFVGPAEALFTPDLAPVRSLEDVAPGAALLLKGAEGLDPPPLFCRRRELPGTRSLGQLTRARADIASAEFYELFRSTTPLRGHTASSSCTSSPQVSAMSWTAPHGSPPRVSQGDPVGKAPRTGRWKEPPGLSMKLSRGGLCRRSSHHDFSTWGRALDQHGRSTDAVAGAEGAAQTMTETV